MIESSVAKVSDLQAGNVMAVFHCFLESLESKAVGLVDAISAQVHAAKVVMGVLQ